MSHATPHFIIASAAKQSIAGVRKYGLLQGAASPLALSQRCLFIAAPKADIAQARVDVGACRVGPGNFTPSTGSPEAVARLRLPQNVACGFTALRSSAVDSQHRKSLQLRVTEAQLWSQ